MFQGKMKAVTFSYDDGVTQDRRLIALFNRYGLKATFNLNSELFGHARCIQREGVSVAHVRPLASEIPGIYAGHEVAAHTLTHPLLTELSEEEIVRQVETDRLRLSELVGYEVRGMAYPGGGVNFNEHVAQVIQNHTGIEYARTTVSSHSFAAQPDLFQFKPTVYHHAEWDALFRLGKEFVDLQTDTPAVYYIWGHAYELDIHDTWDRFEEFCQLISGKDDIFYGTNIEVFDAWKK